MAMRFLKTTKTSQTACGNSQRRFEEDEGEGWQTDFGDSKKSPAGFRQIRALRFQCLE